jgi:hypothetical protein
MEGLKTLEGLSLSRSDAAEFVVWLAELDRLFSIGRWMEGGAGAGSGVTLGTSVGIPRILAIS